jgi:hypothetical protein
MNSRGEVDIDKVHSFTVGEQSPVQTAKTSKLKKLLGKSIQL